jgi:hypothetical protein
MQLKHAQSFEYTAQPQHNLMQQKPAKNTYSRASQR